MQVRYADEWEIRDEPKLAGKVLIYGQSEYSPDMLLTVESLIELRCEIDRFLFTKLTAGRESGVNHE